MWNNSNNNKENKKNVCLENSEKKSRETGKKPLIIRGIIIRALFDRGHKKGITLFSRLKNPSTRAPETHSGQNVDFLHFSIMDTGRCWTFFILGIIPFFLHLSIMDTGRWFMGSLGSPSIISRPVSE